MEVWLVHLWGARVQQAVCMRMPSSLLPRHVLTASPPATARGLHEGPGKPCWHARKLATSSGVPHDPATTCDGLAVAWTESPDGLMGLDHGVGHPRPLWS